MGTLICSSGSGFRKRACSISLRSPPMAGTRQRRRSNRSWAHLISRERRPALRRRLPRKPSGRLWKIWSGQCSLPRNSCSITKMPLAFLLLAIDYTTDIAPLLEKRCGGCHSGVAKMGELSIGTYDLLVRGGNHGKGVVPGKPDESPLYMFVSGKSYPKMPMD